jgi:transposase-like protein
MDIDMTLQPRDYGDSPKLRPAPTKNRRKRHPKITPREREYMLDLYLGGLTQEGVAARLGLQQATVSANLRIILAERDQWVTRDRRLVSASAAAVEAEQHATLRKLQEAAKARRVIADRRQDLDERRAQYAQTRKVQTLKAAEVAALYFEYGWSLCRIARMFDVHNATIFRTLKRQMRKRGLLDVTLREARQRGLWHPHTAA